MQKKLIAVAVAGLMSGAAFAQSNVTVYGVLDSTWESFKNSDTTAGSAGDIERRSRMSSNSSLIGFKGAETLGNGLTAVFQYESGITSDEAGAMSGGRDTLLGLAGGFGTIAIGNLTGPVRSMGAKVDFNPGASSSGFTGLYGQVGGVKTGTDDRSKNAVAYISPSFGGATIIAAYQNGSTTLDGKDAKKESRLYTLGVTYTGGPVFVGVGYINARDPQVAGGVTKTVLGADIFSAVPAGVNAGGVPTAAVSAGSYDDKLVNFRVATVISLPSGTSISALYDQQKYSVDGTTIAGAPVASVDTEAKRTGYMVGVKQAFGANAVYGQYAVNRDLKGSICDFTTLLSCGDTGGKQYTLGFIHEMSKRTMIHAFYTKLTNDENVNYDHYVNAVGNADGADSSVFGAGIRHSF